MPPYTKAQDSDAIDDGWTVTDADGYVIAHADTETLADAIIAAGYNRPSITIGVYGGAVQWTSPNMPMDVYVLDYDCEEKGSNGFDDQGNPYELLQPETADYAEWGYPNGTAFTT